MNFDHPGICLHDGGSIYLVPRIRSTGILGLGIDLLVPRIALGGMYMHEQCFFWWKVPVRHTITFSKFKKIKIITFNNVIQFLNFI